MADIRDAQYPVCYKSVTLPELRLYLFINAQIAQVAQPVLFSQYFFIAAQVVWPMPFKWARHLGQSG